jgi:hypothetical protein
MPTPFLAQSLCIDYTKKPEKSQAESPITQKKKQKKKRKQKST